MEEEKNAKGDGVSGENSMARENIGEGDGLEQSAKSFVRRGRTRSKKRLCPTNGGICGATSCAGA